jgi:glycerol-3-phosphate O-acyltransferase
MSISLLCARSETSVSLKKAGEIFQTITDIFSKEFIYPDMMYTAGEPQKLLYPYFEKRKLISIKAQTAVITEKGAEELLFYAKLAEDYLESYLIVFEAVLKLSVKRFSRKELISAIREHGVRSYHLELVKLAESLSISNYNNAVDFLKKKGCLVEEQSESKNSEFRSALRAELESCLKNVIEYLELIRLSIKIMIEIRTAYAR